MNPKLIRFAVELQNGEKVEDKKQETKILNKAVKELVFFLKPAKATVQNDNSN